MATRERVAERARVRQVPAGNGSRAGMGGRWRPIANSARHYARPRQSARASVVHQRVRGVHAAPAGERGGGARLARAIGPATRAHRAVLARAVDTSARAVPLVGWRSRRRVTRLRGAWPDRVDLIGCDPWVPTAAPAC